MDALGRTQGRLTITPRPYGAYGIKITAATTLGALPASAEIPYKLIRPSLPAQQMRPADQILATKPALSTTTAHIMPSVLP